MELIELLRESPVVLGTLAGMVGLMVGSFLNVVAYRLPLMMERDWRAQCAELEGREPATGEAPLDLVRPRSRCPHCGHGIRAVENIPVLSWLFLRGRCAGCAGPISVRYPIVEAATGILTAVTVLHLGLGWAALAASVFTWALIALTLIDLDHQLLPDSITLPLLWLGLLVALDGILLVDAESAIIGAAAGYLVLWSVYHAFRLLTGKEGMGHGDFKLLAVMGAWLGWQGLPVVILLSTGVGAIVGIGLILARRGRRDRPIPFGPFLAAAGWLALLWGEDLSAWYLRYTGLA